RWQVVHGGHLAQEGIGGDIHLIAEGVFAEMDIQGDDRDAMSCDGGGREVARTVRHHRDRWTFRHCAWFSFPGDSGEVVRGALWHQDTAPRGMMMTGRDGVYRVDDPAGVGIGTRTDNLAQ